MKYVYLGLHDTLLIIISSLLIVEQEEKLVSIVKQYKPPIGWTLVVKAEIVKWLDAGIIYAIFDSPWISPIHVMYNISSCCEHLQERCNATPINSRGRKF
ncbi:unnamed protein product [Spirodela intermedia]|uniref:Uncharacterized protein n=2 Tax=Spirodela intermedia TaxID=51605 RepID=A0ABN7ED76_SPIIN|nr:unnamed protein product [Spirodela intermedia]CAA7395512.1 unnamed protein product [Spirodela intermedia]